MSECYRCDIVITPENETEEHIIINAAGGRLKSKQLLCAPCNSHFGKTFDSELAAVINDLANLLQIKRQRGNPQPIRGVTKSTGEEYNLMPDGNPKAAKPIFLEKRNGSKTEVSISARDEKEFRRILTGVKKKYPELDIDEAIKSAKRTKSYLKEPIQFNAQVGGAEVFKSITKTAINFFIYKGGDKKFIKHLIPYLDGKVKLDIVWMHYPTPPIYNPEDSEVSHIIKLVGNPSERVLYAYIELFNVHNFIIRLNEEYDGIGINETYVFDVLTTTELNKEILLKLTREELLDLFVNKDGKPFAEVQRRFTRTLSIADKRQSDDRMGKLIRKGIQNSLGKYPDGTIITEEIIREAVNETMKELVPFIIHKMESRERYENEEDDID